MAKKDFSGALGAISRPAPAAAVTTPVQQAPTVHPKAANDGGGDGAPESSRTPAIEGGQQSADSRQDKIMRRLELAATDAAQGGLLRDRPVFTREAAEAAGRPLKLHRTRDLVIHPQNPRPISGKSDLDELRADWRAHGQKDPIHIVPYKDGWGIMEGQRRWIVSTLEDTEFLQCFEHPPMSPMEVYCFGMSVHRTRKQQTAIDEAKALEALIETGKTRAQLIEDLNKEGIKITEVDLSRRLAINGVDTEVLLHILAKPTAFTERHLYALARVADRIGVHEAARQAQAVVMAPEDQPVSAKSIERLLDEAKEGKDAPRTRRSSVPKKIRNSDGQDVGLCRGYADGKIEFKPAVALDPAAGEKLHEAVSKTIADFFAKAQPA